MSRIKKNTKAHMVQVSTSKTCFVLCNPINMVFHATKRTRDTHTMMMHTHTHSRRRRRRGRRGPAREIRAAHRRDDWRARIAAAPRLRDALLLAGMVRLACIGGGGRDHLAVMRWRAAATI